MVFYTLIQMNLNKNNSTQKYILFIPKKNLKHKNNYIHLTTCLEFLSRINSIAFFHFLTVIFESKLK